MGGSFPGIGKNRVVSIVPVLAWLRRIRRRCDCARPRPAAIGAGFRPRSVAAICFHLPGRIDGVVGSARPHCLPGKSGSDDRVADEPLPIRGRGRQSGDRIGWVIRGCSFEARLATNLVLACFLIGAGVGHLRDIVTAGNFAPGNAGPILFTDLLTPTVVFLLLWLARSRGEERQAARRRTPARRQG